MIFSSPGEYGVFGSSAQGDPKRRVPEDDMADDDEHNPEPDRQEVVGVDEDALHRPRDI